MLQKGSMRNVKKVLGWVALITGIGMVIFPAFTMPLLVKWKLLVGIVLGVLGYLNTRAGSQL